MQQASPNMKSAMHMIISGIEDPIGHQKEFQSWPTKLELIIHMTYKVGAHYDHILAPIQ